MAKNQNTETQVNLIRIASTDISADASLLYGLSKIKGISYMFANAVCISLKLDKNAKVSSLSEKDIETIEEFLNNPQKEGLPSWLLNHRKDKETGNDIHIVSKDIDFNLLQMRRTLGKLKTYKGLRHRGRLTVRGQRTKSNFRRNKMLAAKKAKTVGGKK